MTNATPPEIENNEEKKPRFGQLGPKFVPLLAFVTAMLVGLVFVIPTSMDWDVASAENAYGREFVRALGNGAQAYNALLEGTTGISFLNQAVITQQLRQTTVFTLLPLGDITLVFIPRNLLSTIVRAMPYVFAGLSVALAFRAGLFNIGAEGQLYVGGLVGVWLGIHPAFANAPMFIHLPVVMAGGIVGGMIWGGIPGLLKARTGAHEVINTIMLNQIAIRLTDWLIKSREPVILLDTTASVPRTPFIFQSAWYPTIPGTSLHLGLVVAVLAAVFVWWLLQKTTLGFELRTVGSNPSAAKYAGMSVGRNIVFAMAIAGGLAGLGGISEVMGVQHNLSPGFFAGIGFDGIAVALLARNNPFAVLPVAFLWAGLLQGAGLMQIRADLSSDLVKVIQALIVMFVAADQIVRQLWRIRAARQEEAVVLSRGWGG